MWYGPFICGAALFGIVLGVDVDFFVDTKDCSNTAIPNHFVSDSCFQTNGPTALRITSVHGNPPSGSRSTITCQTFISEDCSGTALQPIIGGTAQSNDNWGTLIDQCAGFAESMGSFHCQGSDLEK
jgi:hypothetical protein